MAKTKSGILILTKKERKSLEVIKSHILQDISYQGGGTFGTNKEDNFGGYHVDKKEIEKAMLGIEIIDIVLEITK